MAVPSLGSTRRRIDISKVVAGRAKIVRELDNIASISNNKMAVRVSAIAVEYMQCDAKVYEGSDDAVSAGSYTAQTATHAEMNALIEYIAQEIDYRTVSAIHISSPPCKSCAFVLELLGLTDKVITTGLVHKHFTSSWKWPDELKDVYAFDSTRWTLLKSYFADSGYSEQEILSAMVEIVQGKLDR